jgi:peroxiredoxin
MIELGQLERHHEEFAQRNTRVIVVSMEGLDDARKTQASFPHLTVLADEGRGLSEAVGIIDAGEAPDGKDIDAPTTILVNPKGQVRWLFRPSSVITRLSPNQVLQAIDANLGKNQR